MGERKNGSDTPEPVMSWEASEKEKDIVSEEEGVSVSERPTSPAPKKERKEAFEGRLSVDSLSLSKIFGMSVNQDAYFEHVDEGGRTGTFFIADGVGGEEGGDIASKTISDSLQEFAKKAETADVGEEGGEEKELKAMNGAMVAANAALRKKQMEGPPIFERMATTGTLVRLTQDKDGAYHAIVGHVGDSRAYLLLPDGRLDTLTLDAHPALHAVRAQHDEVTAIRVQSVLDELLSLEQLEFLRELIRDGEEIPKEAGVTKQDIAFLVEHMGRALREFYYKYRSMVDGTFGTDLLLSVKRVSVPPGSKLILCSDGVSDGLLKREISAIARGAYDELPYQGVREAASIWGDTPAQALAFAAKERGEETQPGNFHPKSKGPDDTTVVMVDVPKR